MQQEKINPRQKMINLMYLIFIAMLALNMSKKYYQLWDFKRKIVESNEITDQRNEVFATIQQKAVDQTWSVW
jgi:hypothetical protein